MNIKEKIINLSDKYFQQVIEIRQHLHKHPELSFHEVETSKYISDILKSTGIKHQCGIQELCMHVDTMLIQRRYLAH